MPANYKIILASVLLPLTVAVAHAGQIAPIDASTSVIRQIRLPDSLDSRESSSFVSGAKVDSKHVALVDYSGLYCLDTDSAALRIVPRPKGLKGVWSPTGIAYRKGVLYVANYHGNNIIEGNLDCGKSEFKPQTVISTPDTVSPENVAISDDGDTIVSAQYDGSNVAAFRRGADGWKPLWTAKVPLAHGIAIIGSRVYATGLQHRTITAFDLNSGKQLAQAGQLGADPLKTDMMWPTGLANLNGVLILSDAHTGYICSVNQSTLHTETCFGGNGAGEQKFNMPYSTVPFGKSLLILSTYSSRIAEAKVDFTKANVRVVRDWYWTGNERVNPSFTQERSGLARMVAFPTNPYSSVCLMPTWLPGMTCAYAGLANRSQSKFLRFPIAISTFKAGGEIYFVHSFPGHSAHDTYFFSPQATSILNLRIVKDVPYMFMRQAPVGLQDNGSSLVSPTHTIAKDQVSDDFDRMFATLNTSRNKSEIVPAELASQVLTPAGSTSDEFRSRLKASINASKSAVGARFLARYLKCAGDTCDGDGLRKEAIAYATEQMQAQDILLDRVIIPCMLANAKCGSVIWNALSQRPSQNR